MGSATERSRPQIDADGLLAFQKGICDSGINDIMSALVETSRGPIAQRLEQGTHNPLVPGSNPGGPILTEA
jgi:hypothetical protein